MNTMTNVISFGGEGVYRNVPNEIYHGDRTAISSSGLKLILQSPAHFVARQEGPEESTVAKDFGTALHSALLEPEKYRELYVAKPKINRSTKSGKALAETIAIALADKVQIRPASIADIDAMVASAHKHPRVTEMLQDGAAEMSFVWTDESTGIRCKCRPDWLNTYGIWDVKSCLDASPDGFSRTCAKYKYHVSAAYYEEGVRKLTGKTLPFLFVASEKDPPYAVAVYQASEAFLRSGRRLVRQALNRLHECRERGEWPSYQPEGQIEMVELPRWAA